MNESTRKNYKALVVEEVGVGRFSRRILDRSTDDLPAGEVLIQVCFSSLNYKDGLSAVGHKGVTKNYPHTPGIDASGIVEESSSDQFKPGDKVEFRYLVDGHRWRNDEDADSYISTPFFSENSVLEL